MEVNKFKIDKKVGSAMVAILIVSFIGLTWALFAWNGAVNVNITADTSFHVTDIVGSELSSPHAEPVTTTGYHEFTYVIVNDGNTDIQIALSVTDNLPTGANASWDKTFPLTIPVGGNNVPVTLAITATQAGSGSYQWTFTSSEAP
jgi:hypothetical protein